MGEDGGLLYSQSLTCGQMSKEAGLRGAIDSCVCRTTLKLPVPSVYRGLGQLGFEDGGFVKHRVLGAALPRMCFVNSHFPQSSQ